MALNALCACALCACASVTLRVGVLVCVCGVARGVTFMCAIIYLQPAHTQRPKNRFLCIHLTSPSTAYTSNIMRILTRQEFIAAPNGTIFAAGEPHAYDKWKVKTNNCGSDDWIELDLSYAAIDCKSSDELFKILDDMSDNKKSHPLSFTETSRGGDYTSTHFCVMDRADIEQLVKLLLGILQCTPT